MFIKDIMNRIKKEESLLEKDINLVKKYIGLISYYFRKFKVECESCHSKTEEKFYPIFNSLWGLIHGLAFKLKTDIKKDAKLKSLVHEFYNKFKYLPCEICKTHYVEYLRNNPLFKIRTNEDLQKWTVTLHNSVNSRLNKRNFSYIYAKNKYINYNADF